MGSRGHITCSCGQRILIRLCGCTGCYDYSFGAHVFLSVLLFSVSFAYTISCISRLRCAMPLFATTRTFMDSISAYRWGMRMSTADKDDHDILFNFQTVRQYKALLKLNLG